MKKNHSVAAVFDALITQTQLRGGTPSVREISDAALAVAHLAAAYTEVRKQAAIAGMSMALAKAIENADSALSAVHGVFDPRRLPAPDNMGFFCHPDIPGEDERDDVPAMLKALGYAVALVSMESDAPDLADAWGDFEDMTAPMRWTPTPPDGGGWFLVAKYDTEDGPHAMFVRAISDHSATA